MTGSRAPVASVRRLVPFLFGAAGRDDLTGTVLIGALVDCGHTPAAARSAVARMVREGQLFSTRAGRTSHYRLGGLLLESFRRTRDSSSGVGDPPEWTGEFHGLLTSVPERFRATRDRLRHLARQAGYVPLRPGLLIAVTDGWPDLARSLGNTPAEELEIIPVRLAMTLPAAREVAAAGWQLPHLIDRHREQLHRLEAVTTGWRDSAPATLLARYVEVTLPIYLDLVEVPTLPAELLPEHWLLPDLLVELGRVRALLSPAVRDHLARSDR